MVNFEENIGTIQKLPLLKYIIKSFSRKILVSSRKTLSKGQLHRFIPNFSQVDKKLGNLKIMSITAS